MFSALVYPQAESSVFKGVDISRWNGNIDWDIVKDSGLDFAILRVYDMGKDVKFDEYYENAKAINLPIGAYIYMEATTVAQARAEALGTLAALEGKTLEYPLYLDVEDKKVISLDKATVTALMMIELEMFENAGYNPGIYTSESFAEHTMDMSLLRTYDLWIAYWELESSTKHFNFTDMDPWHENKPDADMWQFTANGDGKLYLGSGEYVDLNYCYADYAETTGTVSRIYVDPTDYPVPERELRLLEPKMTGQDIIWLQATLSDLGYNLSVNGTFGVKTHVAVADFQTAMSVPSNGVADTETVKALRLYWEVSNGMRTFNKFGDVNGDGHIRADDARLLLRYAADLAYLIPDQIAVADINHDGIVRASDARKLLRISADLEIIEDENIIHG